ncbi:hypothetical protein BgiBS90_019669, partial [Biomphalaria glabrata]
SNYQQPQHYLQLSTATTLAPTINNHNTSSNYQQPEPYPRQYKQSERIESVSRLIAQ